MKDFFLCVFVLLLSSYGFSQEDNSGEILTDSVEYSFQGKYVFVTYDLNKSPKMLYNTYLEIYDSSNNKIPVKPLSGEFSSVKPGKGKRMVWRIDSDSIYSINGLKVYTVIEKVELKKQLKPIRKGKAVLYSSLFPGYGTYRLTGQILYKYKGVAAYTSIAVGIGFKMTASNTYREYLNATTIDNRNKLYNKTITQDNISKTLLYTAAAIWIFEYIHIYFIKPKSITNHVAFNYRINEMTNLPEFGIKVEF